MKWFLSIFVTSLLARCSSVNTDDFPFPDTDDFPIQTECDIDRPCADPNECCSLLGQCGADNFCEQNNVDWPVVSGILNIIVA
jgi:hypothetical protein